MNGITFNTTPKHIKGISCSVVSCVHHDGVSYCTAKEIAVGPASATNCSQTVCATFSPRHKA